MDRERLLMDEFRDDKPIQPNAAAREEKRSSASAASRC